MVFHAAGKTSKSSPISAASFRYPLFDTQVAAMVCGFGDSVSYDQLVQKITGKHIDKSSRFTDWSHRPLSRSSLTMRWPTSRICANLCLAEGPSWSAKAAHTGWKTRWRFWKSRRLRSASDDAWTRMKMRVRKPSEMAVLMKVTAWREQRGAQSRCAARGAS